jgi:hypothetical protein
MRRVFRWLSDQILIDRHVINVLGATVLEPENDPLTELEQLAQNRFTMLLSACNRFSIGFR